MFIISITYKVELKEVDKIIDQHVAYLEKHYALGHFIASGRKVPRTGSIILANSSSREELDSIIEKDPLFIANVADYDVTEFIPTMTAKGFESLKAYIQ